MRKTKAKAEQNWEASPPLCRSCEFFLNGGLRPHPKTGFVSHRCALGKFNTSPYSICDRWTSKGEVLLK
jgi:hypothetical protein